jgi:hypothetical protein
LISEVSGLGRVVVGASDSPGSICALRYALTLARVNAVPLEAVTAWVPPCGDLAEHRYPDPDLRRLWTDSALRRMWHGRVSRYCLAHSSCPVLAVPAPTTAREMGLGRAVRLLHHRDLTLDEALRHWDAAA